MNNAIRRPIVGKYVLSAKAITAVRNIKVRQALQEALQITDHTVMDMIRKNSDSLTKYAAIEVIMKMTDIPHNEILARSKSDEEISDDKKVVVKELFG